MDNIASFGYWVRRRRKALDLTQAVLARQVGCSIFTIRKIERDERRPSRQLAELLADHLAIAPEQRDQFLSMARGEFVTAVPSPLEDLPSPAFLQIDQEPSTGDDAPFVARNLELAQLDSEPNQLDSEFREALYRQTQGHALFTVEMLRGMQERGNLVQDEQGTYLQAWELCQRALSGPPTSLGTGSTQEIGTPSQLIQVLHGLSDYYALRGERKRVHELGEQIFDLAQLSEDPMLRAQAHQVLGEILFHGGEFAIARTHFEQVIVLYDTKTDRTDSFRYVQQDPGQWSQYFKALVLWQLGYPDQALTSIHDTLTLAQELSHPFHLSGTLYFTTYVHLFRREASTARKRTEELIVLAREQKFDQRLALGNCVRACALVEQGQLIDGIVELRQSFNALEDLGVRIHRAYMLTYLAEAYWQAGQVEEGLTVLAKALATVEKTGEHWCESELYRLKGELLLLQGVENGRVEQQFLKAVDIARRQEAKSLELRAAVSLCRLWQVQGKKAEARQTLTDIYSWFSEGFDTADLKEARDLLEELS